MKTSCVYREAFDNVVFRGEWLTQEVMLGKWCSMPFKVNGKLSISCLLVSVGDKIELTDVGKQ